ncbi:MAG TPA: PilZ domain-containing protein, partial [Bryobacteraceae bacterium]|nr:PilZ domain-containing protein [Bryobacteraceae bacterium]
LIVLRRLLTPGQPLAIKCVGTGRETKALVVDQVESKQEQGFLYGVDLFSSDTNIWEIHFPPVTESEMAAGRILMECVRCHTNALVYLNLSEIAMFQKNQSVSRICEPCNNVTVWSRAVLRKLQLEQPRLAVDPMTGEIEASTAQKDERTEARLPLSTDGCIRTAQYGEDIVQTENISESGASFKSPHPYAGGALVGVSIPYVKGGANVFVQARITWARATAEGGLIAHGLEYLHASRRARRLKPRTKIAIGFIGSGVRSIGTVVNISMRGVLLHCKEEFKPGDVVKLGIEMGHETMRIAASVRQVIPGVGTGFEFTQMGRNDRALLRRLILRIEKQHGR